MVTLISPAKTLELGRTDLSTYTQPEFRKEIQELVKIMKKKSAVDIRGLMNVSENIANLNKERYQNFEEQFSKENAKQALLTFKGDVYTKLEVDEFSQVDLNFAQKHLRIISGLYGLLKPLDLIQPYRLEMGIRLKNRKAKDLYGFWGDKITKAVDKAATDGVIINLASQEYFRSINKKVLNAKVISPVFKEYKNGSYKTIGIYAKQARGRMANFIIKNRITDPEKLKLFNEDGYEYAANRSDGKTWIFIR